MNLNLKTIEIIFFILSAFLLIISIIKMNGSGIVAGLMGSLFFTFVIIFEIDSQSNENTRKKE